MNDYTWCHGPSCHTHATQSRVRGSGTNKVLRTIKIKKGRYNGYQNGIWDYFCNQSCLFDFMRTHLQALVAIAPRTKALETPIKVEKVQQRDYYDHPYTRTRITKVDND